MKRKKSVNLRRRKDISDAIRFSSIRTLRAYTRYSDREIKRLRQNDKAIVSIKEFNSNRKYNVNIEKNIPVEYSVTLDSKIFPIQSEDGKIKRYNFSKDVDIKKPDNSFIEITARSKYGGKSTQFIRSGLHKSVNEAIKKINQMSNDKREHYMEKYNVLLRSFQFKIRIVHEGFQHFYKF